MPRIRAPAPRIRIPHLNWVLRGFYGAYYQAPPLSTVAGPLLDYAVAQGLGIIPLKGERDEENQVGLTIPLQGWTVDVNSFRLRARNYFDHNAIGNSNVFFPLSIAGARIWGEELTVRSPRLFRSRGCFDRLLASARRSGRRHHRRVDRLFSARRTAIFCSITISAILCTATSNESAVARLGRGEHLLRIGLYRRQRATIRRICSRTRRSICRSVKRSARTGLFR